jgi:hypothetical protein
MLVHLIYYYICITWRAYRGIATNLPLLGHFIGIYEGMSLYLLLYVLVHLLLQCTSYYHISGFIGCLICLTGRLIAHLIGKDGFYCLDYLYPTNMPSLSYRLTAQRRDEGLTAYGSSLTCQPGQQLLPD